jgi:hypothetical protein
VLEVGCPSIRVIHPPFPRLGFRQKRRREPCSPRLPSFNHLAYFSHPEQEAQQSAEAQHDVFAAFPAPARLSAITAINRIALMLFIDFSDSALFPPARLISSSSPSGPTMFLTTPPQF